MSKRIWGVLLTIAAMAMAFILVFWYVRRNVDQKPEQQRGTELVELSPTETLPERTTVGSAQETPSASALVPGEETQTPKPSEDYEFVLVDNDDYVAVVKLPENEIYEYTDVILDVLPSSLQEEIREGKFLKSEAELYNFLENYTS